ncbi:hypothetical protein JX265_010642 [Neoarthrinium moseri]|uniref:Replication termination factor 2 n=1 Tax=Neoarthrinium moseri TaxID=1658444 RepID=A0A9P9WE78_9PEZI|nr:uncharacterized protein JN550_009780 [Neoarthrinium moseri]KAI1846265.1 hypothetical protein JX266_007790 [Neoarthrinium moseri]KAI1859165.1 hypothetical protein JX265_010642 [Neoarthrinium moseri]KAI1863254.1 hypothetical protein JN550_009780 [Neoarthrinium moseri]
MGNDGGSIPKRRELVKNAGRAKTTTELKETLLESLTHLWTFCPLSSLPLDPAHTVSDARGRLYSYESVLQCLLPAGDAAVPEAQDDAFRATRIRSLKDVVRLRFALRKDDSGREFRACPVSLKELGAATRSVYLVPCGHVFAEVAMKEIAEAESASKEQQDREQRCPECSEAFETTNIIPILPTTEPELARLTARIEDLKSKGLTHALKKDKSAGKKKRKAGDAAEGEAENGANGKGKKEKKEKEVGIDSRINNPMTASLTARVLAEQEQNNKRRKLAEGLKREAVR